MSTSPQPSLECNLILEGGITSGVVYPALITELAKTYRFKSVGGTSAGAIGAAFAAAAEFARKKGEPGMQAISTHAEQLTQIEHGQLLLQRLFQPTTKTKATFEIAPTLMAKDRLTRVPLKAIQQNPGVAALGALPGLLSVALTSQDTPLKRMAGTALGLAFAGAGCMAASLGGSLLKAKKALEDTHYGMCPGATTDPGTPGLANWLSDAIQTIAHLPKETEILTFRALNQAGIDLRMMTTCLTLNRPYSIPFNENRFFFKAEELKPFLPDHVIQFMIQNSRLPEPRETALFKQINAQGIYALPEGDQLPVVMGLRMSLSFPLLFSAVPLYAVDHRDNNSTSFSSPLPVVFTDGGMSSNLPLHFFDGVLPNCPTFAVNLRPFPSGETASEKQLENIWLPAKSGQGRQPHFYHVHGLTGFGMSLFDTARNWKDGIYVTAPGYSDRIVHVYLTDKEGGLNLDMSQNTVNNLINRGQAAAQALVAKFAGSSPTQWNTHRRTRLISLLSAVEELAREYHEEFNHPHTVDWSTILKSTNTGYKLLASEQVVADLISDSLNTLGGKISQQDATLLGIIKPHQRLRLTLDT